MIFDLISINFGRSDPENRWNSFTLQRLRENIQETREEHYCGIKWREKCGVNVGDAPEQLTSRYV